MRKKFTRGDFERAFLLSFYDSNKIISVFQDIFQTHPPGKLQQLKPGDLGRVIRRLPKNEVNELQDIVAQTLVAGSKALDNLSGQIFAHLQLMGIIPTRRDKLYIKNYQDIWVVAKDTQAIVARMLMPSRMPLEQVVQTLAPENAYYTRLSQVFPNGPGVIRDAQNRDLRLKSVAELSVFADNAGKEELKKRVQWVMQSVADRYHGQGVANRYKLTENLIVKLLYKVFKTIKNGDNVSYPKLYKIFERFNRRNYDISDFGFEDSRLAEILKEEIEKNIPVPYAVIRRRVKQDDTALDKVMRSLYDIPDPTGTVKEPEPQTFRDMLGIRIIVRSTDQVYEIAKYLKKVYGHDFIPHKDFITGSGKNTGYKSYHANLRVDGEDGINIDVQVRTHAHDRDAQLDPGQANEWYMSQKHQMVEKNVPPQVIKLTKAILGLKPGPSVPYIK